MQYITWACFGNVRSLLVSYLYHTAVVYLLVHTSFVSTVSYGETMHDYHFFSENVWQIQKVKTRYKGEGGRGWEYLNFAWLLVEIIISTKDD